MRNHYNERTHKMGKCAAKTVESCPLKGFHGTKEEVQSYMELDLENSFGNFQTMKNSSLIQSHEPIIYKNEDEQEFYDTLRETIGTFTWYDSEFALQPDDPDASTRYCVTCFKIISVNNSYFIEKKGSKCDKCGSSISGWLDTQSALSRDSLKYFDDETVKSTTWFHTTQKENWGESMDNEDMAFVHLGTEKAASDRCSTLLNDPDRTTFIYEVELLPTTQVHKQVHYEDPYQNGLVTVNENAEKFDKIEFGGVTRYLNEMEDCGSISLIANPSTIKIKSVRKVELY